VKKSLLFGSVALLLVSIVAAAGCTTNMTNQTATSTPSATASHDAKTIELTSPALTAGERIPPVFTCAGKNDSPALSFGTAPEGTASLAVICEDPDALVGTFTHWILYNIPPGTTSLPQGIARKLVFPDGSAHCVNYFGKTGYDGPCPPPGKPHRYFFHLYALDTLLDLRTPVTKKSIDAAMQGHIVGQGELLGTYGR
jgi:Raf kinase inhibitor-like YbhB/YbcL family protein